MMHLYLGSTCPEAYFAGAWAWQLVNADGQAIACGSGHARATTNNRMVLRAAVEGLSALPEGTRVEVLSAQNYLIANYNMCLKQWALDRWHKGNGGDIKNLALWQEIDRLARDRQCTFEHLYHDDGDPHLEAVHQLADSAFQRGVATC